MCPDCGTRPEEWDERYGGDMDAYVAIQHRCHGCQAVADEQGAIPEGQQGIKVALIPAAVQAARQIQQELEEQHGKRRRRRR